MLFHEKMNGCVLSFLVSSSIKPRTFSQKTESKYIEMSVSVSAEFNFPNLFITGDDGGRF